MSKTFTVAGTSNLKGVVKFRVANGSAKARTAVLTRSGHTNINLIDLPKPMTKEAAQAYINANGLVTALTSKPAKTPKLTVVKTKPAKVAKTKEVPAETLMAEVGIKPNTKSIEEIARIKAKNLETMRAVTKRLNAMRQF